MGTLFEAQVLDDNSLVSQAQKGNQYAFDRLLKRYQSKTQQLVRRYVANPDDIDDICQEAYIKLYRALPQFDHHARFYTWYYRIVLNTIKNYLLKEKRYQAQQVNIDALHPDIIPAYLKTKHSPEQLLISEQAKGIFIDTLKEMPDCLSCPMLLFDVKGLSYEEIAEEMDCPIGTVRSRIFRARHLVEKNITS